MRGWKRWLPSKRWLVLPPVALGVAVVVVLVQSKKELPRSEAVERSVPLRVIEARRRPVRPTIIGYGTARPKRVWTAVSEVGGRVIETHPELRSGNFVKAGDVLVRIDRTDYQLRVRQRRADLEQAQAQVREIRGGLQSDRESLEIQQSLLEVRRREVDRLDQLRGSSAASLSETDVARAAYLQQAQSVQNLQKSISLAPAQIESAEAAVELAKARLDEAERDLQRTVLRAPFSGLLADVRLEEEQFVAANERLFELHDIETMEVEAQFSLAQLSRLIRIEEPPADAGAAAITERSPLTPSEEDRLLAGLSAEVIVRSGDVEIRFDGQPVRAAGTIDQQTRTLGIVCEVTQTGQLGPRRGVTLRSGAYCEVRLRRQESFPQVLVPRTALVGGDIYVVDQDSRLRREEVEPGIAVGSDVVVQGLSEGSRVVVQPPADAADGMLVDPRPHDLPARPPKVATVRAEEP